MSLTTCLSPVDFLLRVHDTKMSASTQDKVFGFLAKEALATGALATVGAAAIEGNISLAGVSENLLAVGAPAVVGVAVARWAVPIEKDDAHGVLRGIIAGAAAVGLLVGARVVSSPFAAEGVGLFGVVALSSIVADKLVAAL